MSRATLKSLALALAAVDLSKLAAGAEETAIDRAVARYSQDRPRLHRATLVLADGGTDLPVEFEGGFSEVQAVEYPTGQRPPVCLKGEDFYVYPAADARRLEVLAASSGDCIATFTRRHVAVAIAETASAADKAAACTIPDDDFEAVATWAAALLCDMEASRLAGKTQATIKADSVDTGAVARGYAQRAKDLRKQYLNALGVEEKKASPAGTNVSFSKRDSRGRVRLTHPLPTVTGQ